MKAECGGELEQMWYRNKETLLREYQAHGTLRRAAVCHGTSNATLSDWWGRLGLPPLQPGPKSERDPVLNYTHHDDDVDQTVVDAIKGLGNDASIEDLADALETAPKNIRKAVERLREKGYRITELSEGELPGGVRITVEKFTPPTEKSHKILFGGDTYRFGIAGDTHLGSKDCMLDSLHTAYDMFQSEGIETVYHPGDLVCGIGVYRGQINEIELHTMADQVAFALENFPKRTGVHTRIIAGNHDLEGEYGRVGANPVTAVCNQRDDMTYDGDYNAWYILEPYGTKIYVVHPKGGSAYARSYKLQKFAEAFEGGKKPHVLIAGHYHDSLYLPSERGIQMIKAGCFESGGSLGIRLPLKSPATGFWIVEMTLQDDGTVARFKPEWFPVYHGRKVEKTNAG